MKVLLQYLTLPHYRRSLFQRLASHPELEFSVACGRQSIYAGLADFEPEPPLRVCPVRNRFLSIGGWRLVWQHGLLRAFLRERPDCLILLGVDPHYVSTLLLFALARLRGTRIVWWGHGTLGRQGGLGRALRAWFFRRADAVLVYAPDGRERLLARGVADERVRVVWNCLNDEDYPAGAGPAAPGAPTRLCHLGRLTADKRLPVLLDALERLRRAGVDLALDVIGDGPERGSLEAAVAERGLSRCVRFHGALYGPAVSEVLSTAALTVLPGWAGLAAVQSLAHGVPVITNDDLAGQPPEIAAVVPDRTGAYFRADDPAALADTIRHWLPRAPQAADACRRLVAERYTPERVADAIAAALVASD